MMGEPETGGNALPEARSVGMAAIGAALGAGFRDFRKAPAFGLFFSAVYVLGGWLLLAVASAAGREWWLIPVVAGFPLLGPFTAVGLYEVSRRIEAGEPLDWPGVLGTIFRQKDRQLPSMTAVILVLFLFWVFVAHTLFALFLGLTPASVTAGAGPLDFLLQGKGPLMLMIGTLVGAGFAGVLFGMVLVGLPVLLDREVDFISAIILSFQAAVLNVWPMLAWGLTITAILLLGMAPLFLGLLVALPVLGHASWHMYRALTEYPPE
ncbi:MAG: DUF2189 domain-containing protein [Paracoccaceae bacterium]